MGSIKNVFLKIFMVIGGLIVLCIIFSLSADIQAVAPGNVRVMLDHKYKTYASPECLNPNVDYKTSEFEVSTLDHARSLNYNVDSTCSEDSLFPSRSYFSHYTLEKMGLLKPLVKWNADGTWNL